MVGEAKGMIEALFDLYMTDLEEMPAEFAGRASADDRDQTGKARVVADYIAGMTDRFAIAEYQRLN